MGITLLCGFCFQFWGDFESVEELFDWIKDETRKWEAYTGHPMDESNRLKMEFYNSPEKAKELLATDGYLVVICDSCRYALTYHVALKQRLIPSIVNQLDSLEAI